MRKLIVLMKYNIRLKATWYEMFAGGISADEIIEDYPQLDKDKIMACLAYVSTRD